MSSCVSSTTLICLLLTFGPTGTFAVISLMISASVDQICGNEEGNPPVTVTTVDPINLLNGNNSNSTDSFSCPIQVTIAVTFLGGIVQV